MSKISYREDDDKVNSPHSCTSPGCTLYPTSRDGVIDIKRPHLKDLDQKIPSFSSCDNYGICRASNPNPLNDDTKTNDNELHQQLCVTFMIDYLQEMDIITKVKARLECKINVTLPALLPNKIVQDSRGLATSSDKTGHE